MFNVGDMIIYSSHGICCIDDICEKTYFGVTKNYYVLHPLGDDGLKISVPVDSDKATMLNLITGLEAEEILESFRLPGINWIELNSERNQIYSQIVKTGNRKEISKIVNTLMRKKIENESIGKKLYEQDNKLLAIVQNILFMELAIALDRTFEEINEKINGLVNENQN